MKFCSIKIPALAMAMVFPVTASQRISQGDLSCVTSLDLPTRGAIAPWAGASGTVTVTIQFGEQGHVSKLDFQADNRFLEADVRVSMWLSKFSEHCKGRRLKLIFSFILRDPPTDAVLPPAVVFFPPNRFELNFQRRKPIAD